MGIKITGTGYYVPERVLTNSDLEGMVETSDEWIVTRTGIRERHIAGEGTITSDLAVGAAERAIESAGIRREDIDLVIVSTMTPDMATPSTAVFVQRKLGLRPCMCFDIEAACTGLLYGLDIVHAMLTSGKHRNALLIGAERMSSVMNWQDRTTCVLFGDAASAVVVQSGPGWDGDFYQMSEVCANGEGADVLQIPGFGTACPPTPENIAGHMNSVKMNGQKTFQMAIAAMSGACQRVLDAAGVGVDSLRWVIPHQANDRIISAVSTRLGLGERVYRNVDRFGNTSSASIGICLDELNRSGRLERGDLVLLTAFGAGMTWAAQLIRW